MVRLRKYILDCSQHKLWRIGSASVHAGIVAYGIVFIMFLVARFTIGEQWNVVAFADNLFPWLCWTGMALAVLGLPYRDRWLLVGLQLPAFIFFGLTYGNQFLSNTTLPQPGGPTLTVVFYNVCG